MEWNAATFWWCGVGLLVLAELLTGTFYLLMLAVGLLGAAVSAHLGASGTAQLLVAAAVGSGAVALWHRRRGVGSTLSVNANPDVQQDLGGRVQVERWSDLRTTQVSYRGANWHARLAEGATVQTGPHVIVALDGNQLVLRPVDL